MWTWAEGRLECGRALSWIWQDLFQEAGGQTGQRMASCEAVWTLSWAVTVPIHSED